MFHVLTTIGICMLACFHAAAASCQLRVGTFNIRCINMGDKGARSWGERREGLADYANKLKCDVIGFQEVTPKQLDFLKSRMSDYVFVATFRERNRRGRGVPSQVGGSSARSFPPPPRLRCSRGRATRPEAIASTTFTCRAECVFHPTRHLRRSARARTNTSPTISPSSPT